MNAFVTEIAVCGFITDIFGINTLEVKEVVQQSIKKIRAGTCTQENSCRSLWASGWKKQDPVNVL